MKTTLLINQIPLASSAKEVESGRIGVLSGLTIESGRANPLDQPEPSTLSATLIAPSQEKGRQWLEKLEVGARIDVSTNLTLDSQPVTRLAPTRTLFKSNTSLLSGNTVNLAPGVNVFYLASAPWEEEGKNPNAWETKNPRLPKDSPIRVELTLTQPKNTLPPTVSLVSASGPWINSITTSKDIPYTSTVRGSVKVYTYAGNINLPASGHPALMVKVQPVRWQDLQGSSQWLAKPETWTASGTVRIEGSYTISHIGALTRDIPVYTGFIDSWTARRDGDKTLIQLSAVDVLAVLARRVIGAPPRKSETVSQRINWILQTANLPLTVSSSATRDPLLSTVDVDAKSAWDLIKETANSAALTVWAYTHGDGSTGLYLDDADAREPGDKLIIDPDGTARLSQLASTRLPASIVENHGATITQDSTTVASQALVSYLAPTLDAHGAPATEIKSVVTGQPGSAILKVNTALTTSSDAIATGDAWLRRTPVSGWKISGISFKASRAPNNLIGALLNLNTRSACPITVEDMPTWIPSGTAERFIVEGVNLSFIKNDCHLALTLNRPTKAGKSIKWSEVPAGLSFSKSRLTWADTAGLTL